MQVTKCDKCHKAIKRYEDKITVRAHGLDLFGVEFHVSCAQAVMIFLQRNGFFKPKKSKVKG